MVVAEQWIRDEHLASAMLQGELGVARLWYLNANANERASALRETQAEATGLWLEQLPESSPSRTVRERADLRRMQQDSVQWRLSLGHS